MTKTIEVTSTIGNQCDFLAARGQLHKVSSTDCSPKVNIEISSETQIQTDRDRYRQTNRESETEIETDRRRANDKYVGNISYKPTSSCLERSGGQQQEQEGLEKSG